MHPSQAHAIPCLHGQCLLLLSGVTLRLYRLSARTHPSQGWKAGSIPARVTKITRTTHRVGQLYFCRPLAGIERERGHPFSRTGRASRAERSFDSTESKRALGRFPLESLSNTSPAERPRRPRRESIIQKVPKNGILCGISRKS